MKVKAQKRKKHVMEITLSNKVLFTGLKPETSNAIQNLFTIPNPEFVEAEKMGLYTGCIPKTLELYEIIPNGLICPKAALWIFFERGFVFDLDKTNFHHNQRTLNPVNFTFQGELGPLPLMAVASIIENINEVWEPPTWINKEIVVLYLIAQKKQPTLIVVHSMRLLEKWVDRIEKYLGIKAADVGKIAGGKVRIGEKITVAMVQTLHKRVADVAPHIGHLILDAKTSRVTGMQYLETVEQFDSKYQLWLNSSSVYRQTFLDEIIKYYAGPTIRQIEKPDLLNNGDLYQGEAFFIPTGFKPVTDPSVNYSLALTEMTQDLDRNLLIAETILKYRRYGITLVLSERQQQCEAIGDLLKHHYCKSDVAVFNGNTPAKQIQQIMKDRKRVWGNRFLLATNQTIGKVFDLPKIDTLVMTTPFNFSSSFLESIPPALRPGYEKDRTVIMNFVDDHDVFENSARTNWETYKQLGLSIFGRIEEKEEKEEKEEWCADSPFDDDIDSLFGN